jgi:hypothetical protein
MNFIASVAIAVMDSESLGFLVFMDFILNKETRTLFLPVSTFDRDLGGARTSLEKFLNGIAD